ncbi:cytochrome P450 [Actinorhabdospora filicis]|nr:cytochrome P450 [Actinorhabdospora filicis]
MERTCPFHPPAAYSEIQDGDAPVKVRLTRSGRIAWLITSHDQVRQVLAHPGVSSDRTAPNFPLAVNLDPEEIKNMPKPALIGLDPPEHSVQRRQVITEFTVRRTKDLRPRIQQIVDDAIDDLLAAGKGADLVEHVSLPVPSMVICELLGVPYADHDYFQERTRALLSRDSTIEQGRRALNELGDYFVELLTAKEKNTPDDMLGRLITAGRADGTYDRDELAALARLLLIAGHETTANMISLGTVALLENPEQLAKLKADSGLLPTTVEELLRVFAIADVATSRTALVDMEVGGVLIKAGDGIIASGLAASHDPGVFPEPHAIDVTRSARAHVAFGYGVHQCLGQNLARAELEIAYETLFRRVPGLTLAVPAENLPYKNDAFIYGIHEVPVTW